MPIVAFLWVIMFGVVQEADRASFDFYPAIVQRALIDQVKEGSNPRHLTDSTNYTRAQAQLFEEISKVKDKSNTWLAECSLKVDLSKIDPLQVPGVVWMVLNKRAPKVAVFFYGNVPEIQPYLDPLNADRFLGSRHVPFDSVSMKEYDSLNTYVSSNQIPWLERNLKSAGGSISAFGKNCGQYSYIYFEGQVQ